MISIPGMIVVSCLIIVGVYCFNTNIICTTTCSITKSRRYDYNIAMLRTIRRRLLLGRGQQSLSSVHGC
jgi:hypothetical protein